MTNEVFARYRSLFLPKVRHFGVNLSKILRKHNNIAPAELMLGSTYHARAFLPLVQEANAEIKTTKAPWSSVRPAEAIANFHVGHTHGYIQIHTEIRRDRQSNLKSSLRTQ